MAAEINDDKTFHNRKTFSFFPFFLLSAWIM